VIPQRNSIVLKNRYYYLTKKGIVDRLTNKWNYGKGNYGGNWANSESDDEEEKFVESPCEKRSNPYVESCDDEGDNQKVWLKKIKFCKEEQDDEDSN